MNYLKLIATKITFVLQVIITIIFLYLLFHFTILPNKYMYGIIAIVIILCIVAFLLQYKVEAKSLRNIISNIISIIVSIGLIIISIGVYKGTSFINSLSGMDYETDALSVIVLKNSDYTKLNDLNGKIIAMNEQEDQKNLTKALKDIREQLTDSKTEYKNYVDWNHLTDSLYNEYTDAIVVNEIYRSMLEEKHPDFDTETRVIYQFKIENKIDNIAHNGAVKDGVFHICISGIDTYGPVSTKSRSDVNMVMSVNMNTHKILMTGIPRDYYVTLASKGAKDKLTHSGIYGINETVNTIGNLLDTDIDYYFRINFTSLVNVVDVLGGIDVESDQALPQLGINKGMNHMDGKTALAYSRERYSYTSGDRHRIQNQQDVMMAIINKLTSPSVLSNYQEILEKVDGTFETNMSSEDIMTVIKMQLSDLEGYQMFNKYLDGSGQLMTGGYSMPKSKLYYMIPNENSVKEAIEDIRRFENETVE